MKKEWIRRWPDIDPELRLKPQLGATGVVGTDPAAATAGAGAARISLAGRVNGKAVQGSVASPEEQTTLGRDYSKAIIRQQEGSRWVAKCLAGHQRCSPGMRAHYQVTPVSTIETRAELGNEFVTYSFSCLHGR